MCIYLNFAQVTCLVLQQQKFNCYSSKLQTKIGTRHIALLYVKNKMTMS